MSNWSVKHILDMWYDKKLHGDFDQELHQTVHAFGRGVKSERIGKKYQWITLHILLAWMSDHFEIIEDNKLVPYSSSWQCDARDIDPTFIPNKSSQGIPFFSNSCINVGSCLDNKKLDENKWIENSKNTPDPKKIITLADTEKREWLLLSGHFSWSKSILPEYKEYEIPSSTLFYRIKSFLVKKENINPVFKFLQKRDVRFFQDLMHKNQEFDHTMTYLGEYPWAKNYQSFESCYDWFDTINGINLPEKILMTNVRYNNTDTDRSLERDSEAVHLDLPTKLIVNEMNLSQNHMDGRFFDKDFNLMSFDPSIFNKQIPSSLIIRKKEFLEFLNSCGYAVLWGLYGEKYITNRNHDDKFRRSEIKGVYTTNDKNEIFGEKSCLVKEEC